MSETRESSETFTENPLLHRLSAEFNIKHLETLENVARFAELIRTGTFSIPELVEAKFCPYFPDHLNVGNFNGFSRSGIVDVEKIVSEKFSQLRESGMLHTWIVGSAAVGLSHTGKHGVRKQRLGNSGFFYRRAGIEKGDIDTDVLVRSEDYDRCVDVFREIADGYRDRAELKSPPNSISFYFIPFEEEIEKLNGGHEIYGYVTHILWKLANYDVHEDDMGVHRQLEEAALDQLNNNAELKRFFFNNAADRWAHGRYKMLIKKGNYRWIYRPAAESPSLFSASKGIKSKRPNGYFEI